MLDLAPKTSVSHRSQIHHWAKKSFKDHELKQIESSKDVMVWYCGHPSGSSIYHFYVAFMPHAIVIYGDIGDMLIRPGWNRGLGWLRSATHEGTGEHLDYVFSKVPGKHARKEFFPGDVIEHLQDEARGIIGYFDEGTCVAQAQELLDEWGEQVGMSYCDGGEPRDWWEACREKGLDYEYAGGFDDYDAEMYWCGYALCWFVREWVKQYGDNRASSEGSGSLREV